MLREISRVLTDDGVFISITYGVPSSRMLHFEKAMYGWKVEQRTLPKYEGAPANQVYYIYIMKKGAEKN